jgi:hypothetical protein
MTNPSFQSIYDKGLDDERKVKSFLLRKGYLVEDSTRKDNKDLDIDCYVGGIPTSIKSSHAGVKYGHIGFELCVQLSKFGVCSETEAILADPAAFDMNTVSKLRALKSWQDSWFYSGKATVYLFYQGDKLRAYHKQNVIDYTEANGFDRIRPLSYGTKTSQKNGKHYHSNAVCGYLKYDRVTHTTWDIGG